MVTATNAAALGGGVMCLFERQCGKLERPVIILTQPTPRNKASHTQSTKIHFNHTKAKNLSLFNITAHIVVMSMEDIHGRSDTQWFTRQVRFTNGAVLQH